MIKVENWGNNKHSANQLTMGAAQRVRFNLHFHLEVTDDLS